MRGFLAGLLAPFSLAAFPVVFLYRQNADLLNLSSLALPLSFHLGLSAAIYTPLYFACRRDNVRAGNATTAILLGYILYGSLYEWLLKADIFTVRHAALLPLALMTGGYLAYSTTRLVQGVARAVQRATALVGGCLVLINVAGIVPAEYSKLTVGNAAVVDADRTARGAGQSSGPDIYYIILDEFAGFDAVREYWGYDEIDEFEDFLRDRGFFVAGASRSRTLDTLVEIASRLNYRPYPPDQDSSVYFEAIADNQIMRDLSRAGYTTVAIEELRSALAYESATPIQADFDLRFDPGSSGPFALRFDPFATMVFEQSMLRPLAEANLLSYGMFADHGKEVLWAFHRLANMDDIPSPRFVYAHLLFPHAPFIFDRSGGPAASECWFDWHCYLDTYIFSTSQARRLIESLLASADPDNPPIIVLQSDHGMRNDGGTTLADYPEELGYHILNALYLPGFESSQLQQDLDPILTFPLILNHYFDAGIPMPGEG